eukprot:6578451-Alexandrium_andersonii.AAC.1
MVAQCPWRYIGHDLHRLATMGPARLGREGYPSSSAPTKRRCTSNPQCWHGCFSQGDGGPW